MPPAIVTENLRKEFPRRVAVDNLNLEIEAGEIFGFLGPNGAGKTTTIAMLLHLVRPSAGRALLLGNDVWQQPQTALRHVGALVEEPAFYPYLSGYHNLLALARIDGLPPLRVDAVLDLVELTAAAREPYKHYSQGMRQRLGLAAALLHEPRILILDEPLNGLDPAGTYEMRSLLRTLSETGHTIFLSSHQLSEVQQTCRRVAVLKDGKVIAEGDVQDLLRGEGGLLLRIEGDAAPAIELLRRLPWVAGVEQQRDYLAVNAAADRAAELNRCLVNHGVAVAEIRPRELQLETFFLRITGDSAE